MRKITKSPEPPELSKWKTHHKKKDHLYDNINDDVRNALRQIDFHDQLGLCAYCCQALKLNRKPTQIINEHVEARKNAPNRALDFSNIVASCNTIKRCDHAKKAQSLPLTPLMYACETELKFYLTGEVKGLTERAEKAIKVLNLNNKGLKGARAQAIHNLTFSCGSNPKGIKCLDDNLMVLAIQDLQKVNNQGLLEPYSPILINVLKSL